MSVENPFQAAQDLFRQGVEQQLAQMTSLTEQVAKGEAAAFEQMKRQMAEFARLQEASLGWFSTMSSAYRQMGLEAVKRATEAATPKA